MPKDTFFRLPDEKRKRLVDEAIRELSTRTYAEASLSQIMRKAGIPKGSFYQYFDDKLDLYRWLLCDEVPRRKRAFLGKAGPRTGEFWQTLEEHIERGMAFLVEHPSLARLSAAAADPTAIDEVRGLHEAICEAGVVELREVLKRGMAEGALRAELDLDAMTRLVGAVIGPGLTGVILGELGAPLHEILASAALRKQLDPARRGRLAQQAVAFLRGGIGAEASRPKKPKELA